MVVEVDRLDEKIMAVLNQNARLPSKTVGKLVGCSREVAAYRIKRLLDNGVITGFYCILSASRLGLQSYSLLVSFENYSPHLIRRMFQELACHKLVRHVRRCRGVHDAIIGIQCRNRKELSEFIDAINVRYGKIVREYQLLLPVKPLKFKSFFSRNLPAAKTPSWNFNPAAYSVSRKDLKVLSAIANDARAELKELSKKTALSPEVVSYALKRLARNGILKQYSVRIDMAKLGYSEYSVFLKINGFTSQAEKNMIALLEQSPNILRAQRVVGNYDVELQLVFRESESFEKELDELWAKLDNRVKYAAYAMMLGPTIARSCTEELLRELKPINR